MANTATVEAANESASSAKAVPVPAVATRTPPSAGPSRRSVIGRTNWSSEFAAGRSLPGTTSGTIASNAGVKNAVPIPYTATMARRCQKVRRPVSASAASTPTTSARPMSAQSMTIRRSSRSLRIPAGRRKTMVGTVIPIPRMESAAGAFHSS